MAKPLEREYSPEWRMATMKDTGLRIYEGTQLEVEIKEDPWIHQGDRLEWHGIVTDTGLWGQLYVANDPNGAMPYHFRDLEHLNTLYPVDIIWYKVYGDMKKPEDYGWRSKDVYGS